MITIPLKSRVSSNGVLELHVETGLPESEVEVIVVVQPSNLPKSKWPEGFIERTYGSFADDPLVRPDQGELPDRERLD